MAHLTVEEQGTLLEAHSIVLGDLSYGLGPLGSSAPSPTFLDMQGRGLERASSNQYQTGNRLSVKDIALWKYRKSTLVQ